MTRTKLLCLHLSITALVAFTLFALMRAAWYPGDYFDLMGAGKLLLLLVACDLVLGALLSTLTYGPHKTRLARGVDAATLTVLRIAAVGYGLHVVVDSRPVYVVFAIDRFNVVAAGELPADLPEARLAMSFTGPRMKSLRMPTDMPGRMKALELELSGTPLHALPEYLTDYDARAALARAEPIAQLFANPTVPPSAVKAALASAGLKEDEALWLPVQTRFGFATALLRRSDGSVTAYIDADPYPPSPPR